MDGAAGRLTSARTRLRYNLTESRQLKSDYQADIDAIGKIDAVPTILDVVCRTTGMGFAAVARVTEDRWIACSVLDQIAFGLQPGGELKVETTICHEIRQSGEPVIINSVAEDPVYCGHPTPAMYGFQSYISMPILRKDGSFFGTLCAIDPMPAKLKDPEIVGMFRLFAELIAAHLDSVDQIAVSEQLLARERAFGAMREKFIAVLGHDLRNPLASVVSGARMLMRKYEAEPDSRQILLLMQGSLLRMRDLIDNIADFARSRLGSGLTLDLEADALLLERTLDQVVDELRTAHPDRSIIAEVSVEHGVPVDHGRIAQLLSNLIGNALSYGDVDKPVRVSAKADKSGFELAVENGGTPIPAETLANLFEPFARGESGRNVEGLGLGLFIASEIAKAHGGTLGVTSDESSTKFVLDVRAAPPAEKI
jgi:signal transduction histidine kinase